MKIPINKIQENLYTEGNEFVEKKSFRPYKGYYYSTGNNFYSGKIFNLNAIEIVKKSKETEKVSSLNNESLNYFFNSSNSTKGIIINQTEIKGIHFTPSEEDIKKGFATRYFIKKQNTNPILIKEINKNTFNSLNNPIYLKSQLIWKVNSGFNQEDIDNLDKYYMNGIKAFLAV